MNISAVVVAHGQSETLQACLASLREVVDEIIVVDNGTGRGFTIAKSAGVDAIRTSNRGFGAAQNLGAQHTKGEFLLILNPDALMVPRALDAGVKLLRGQPRAAAVQGVCRSPDGQPQRSQGVLLSPIHLWGRAVGLSVLLGTRVGKWAATRRGRTADHVKRVPLAPSSVEWLSATALLARRSALEEVGGFDEHFFMYGEDLDLCHRLTLKGWQLVALPTEWAIHVGGASFSDPWNRELHWWRGTLQFAAKWWGAPSWQAAVGAAYARAVTLLPRNPRSLSCVRSIIRDVSSTRRATGSVGVRPQS